MFLEYRFKKEGRLKKQAKQALFLFFLSFFSTSIHH